MNPTYALLPVLAMLLSTAGAPCQDSGPEPPRSRGRLLAVASTHALLGTWVAIGEEAERLEFRPGGVLVADGTEMRYRTQGNRLTIDMEGGSLQGTFEVAGAYLTITLSLPDGSLRSERYRREAGEPVVSAGIDRSLTKAFRGDEQGALALVKAFLDPKTDRVALTKALRPDSADFRAIFGADAAKAEEAYRKMWDAPGFEGIGGNAGQTETLLWAVSTEDIAAWNEKTGHLPGGYRTIKDRLAKGLVVHRFKFVKPGETAGMAYDGLIHVNGHWVWVPKPWRALRTD